MRTLHDRQLFSVYQYSASLARVARVSVGRLIVIHGQSSIVPFPHPAFAHLTRIAHSHLASLLEKTPSLHTRTCTRLETAQLPSCLLTPITASHLLVSPHLIPSRLTIPKPTTNPSSHHPSPAPRARHSHITPKHRYPPIGVPYGFSAARRTRSHVGGHAAGSALRRSACLGAASECCAEGWGGRAAPECGAGALGWRAGLERWAGYVR